MSVRIAVMTDVHGNAPALKAVFDHIDAQGDIAHIYNLGDNLSIGWDTNTVLDMLFARTDMALIQGNHEGYVLDLLRGEQPKLGAGELEHQRWVAARIDPGHVDRLAALPRNLTAEYHGQSLLFQHYHPGPVRCLAPVERDPTAESLEARYSGTPWNAVCFGHHHPVHLFRSASRLYFNPGSLGCCDRPVARYGVLTIAPGSVDAELREVPYDNREFLAAYERLGVPERAFIRRIFHGGQG